MKINPKTICERIEDYTSKWHRWFAWYPIWLDKYPNLDDEWPSDPDKTKEETLYARHGVFPIRGDRVWLQFVQRRAFWWAAIDHVRENTWHYKEDK